MLKNFFSNKRINYCSFSPQFSLFGSRSNNRTANPPLPSSPCVSVTPSPQTFRRAERRPCSGGLSKAEFLERVRRSNQACQEGEYGLAVRLYTEALTADPQNCILYSNRSAAYLRLGQYNTALDDAIKARLINPKWPKVRSPTRLGCGWRWALTPSMALLHLVAGCDLHSPPAGSRQLRGENESRVVAFLLQTASASSARCENPADVQTSIMREAGERSFRRLFDYLSEEGPWMLRETSTY